MTTVPEPSGGFESDDLLELWVTSRRATWRHYAPNFAAGVTGACLTHAMEKERTSVIRLIGGAFTVALRPSSSLLATSPGNSRSRTGD